MMYQGLNKRSEGSSAPEPRFQTRRMEVKGAVGNGGGHWLDRMLGKGSREALKGSPVSREIPKNAPERPATVLAMRAVRSNDDVPKKSASPEVPGGSKGILRWAALGLALVGLGAYGQPWKHLPSMRGMRPFWSGRTATARAPQPTPVPTKEPEVAKKVILPLEDAKGSAVAYWRSETGQWYGVNAAARLFKTTESEVRSHLDLPRISSAKIHDVESGSVRNLALDLAEGLLGELLPLSDDIAPEVASISFEGSEVRLHLNGGAMARLGEGDFKRKEQRLARVLYHLSARKQRAMTVDMRFEKTAAVRLASR